MTEKCEILAPVGNREMLIAAVRSGADAVYLGAKDFNARRNAENFGDFDLTDAIKYSHTFGVKVYLTLNISLKENEIKKAADLAVSAYKNGIDGVIITDLGLCKILKEICPDLPLHASTQMTVHNISAIPTLAKLGIKRIVVAREMCKNDMKEFVKAAFKMGIETEVFVHGALCMSMSGQCLLSAMLGGRSGNRGLCAGPCRLPFSNQKGSSYALSLKDLSLINEIGELKDMGVASLKIEGRMKRPEYVAAAVTAVKKCRDKEDYVNDFMNLQAIFSRSGFTNGYYQNQISADMFGIRTKEDVTAAADKFSEIHTLYRSERQSIKINAEIIIRSNSPAVLSLWQENGVKITVTGETPESAKTRALTKDDVVKNLSKLGGTPYILENVEAYIDENLFLPASALNALRNSATQKLTDERIHTSEKTVFDFKETEISSAHKNYGEIICRFENPQQIPKDLNGISAIMIPLESEPPCLPDNIIKIAELPRAIKNEKTVIDRLKLFKEAGFTHAAIGNIAQIELSASLGFKIFSSFSMNVFNSFTAEFLKQNQAEFITLSPELTFKEAQSVSCSLPLGIFAYGRLPLMLTANCPVKDKNGCAECDKKRSLTDRMGIKFPVRCRMGYSELLNCKPIFLADKPDARSFNFEILYFTDENPQETKNIIDAYTGITVYAPDDFTRGLYYRGVE